MQLGIRCTMKAIFVQKISGEKLVVDNNFGIEYNEDSEEYKELCKRYENNIGFDRNKNKEKFDRELLTLLSADVKQEGEQKIDKLTNIYKKFLEDKDMTGWIEFGGYIINPSDFSAIRFADFNVQIFKQ